MRDQEIRTTNFNRVTPLILATALFMEQMDSTVIATSLPAIAADIGTEPVALKLALTTYYVALAIFIPISGWMSDRFGARNIFRLAIVVFVAGSMACAFSHSLEAFVISRFFQGMGASMMTPVGRLLLVRTTPRNELIAAMALLTIPAQVGPIVGPLVGGFLTTYLSWHWIFWINVPIGTLGVLMATKFLPVTEFRNERKVDFFGFVLSAIAFSGLVSGLSILSLPAVPIVYGYLTLAIGVVTTLLYLLHAQRVEFPILDPKMFRYRYFRTAAFSGTAFRIGIGATPFLLPLMLQIGFGLNPFESGAITFVGAIGAIASKFFTQRVFARFGFPRVLTVGALVGGLLLAVNGLYFPDTPHSVIMLTLLVGGVFRSTLFTGLNAFSFSEIKESDVSQATAINAVMQQLSLALGVSLAGGVLSVSAFLHGRPLALQDFHIAFWVVGAISAAAAIGFMRLPPDAGREMSGHRGAGAGDH